MTNWLRSFLSHDIAIDLGTSSVLVFIRGQGIAVNEPAVVAISTTSNGRFQVAAVGQQAKDMIGRTPKQIKALRPIQKGVISDFDTTVAMLRYFLTKACSKTSFFKPRVVVGIPVGVTEVERRAVKEAAQSAGAGEVHLIEEPMAAAIGADMPITEPFGNMIVDIGSGTIEVAIISLGGIVYSKSVRLGGSKMDEAIVSYVKKEHSLFIGLPTAERIKISLGSAIFPKEINSMSVKGRDVVTGIPKTIEISNEEVCKALVDSVKMIVEVIKTSLENTPPELASDIVDRGIMLSGGGALLNSLDVLICNETGVPTYVTSDPLCSVVLGAGKVLEELDRLKQILSP